jgi:hypothetical protein
MEHACPYECICRFYLFPCFPRVWVFSVSCFLCRLFVHTLAVSPYFTYFSCYTIIATFALVLRLFAKYKHLGSPRCEMKPICWEYYFRETHLLSTILMKPTFKSTKIAKNLQLEVLRIRADGIKVRGIQLQRAAALKIKGRLDQASDDTVNRRADQRNERLETEFNGSRVRKPYTLNPAVFLFMMNSSS